MNFVSLARSPAYPVQFFCSSVCVDRCGRGFFAALSHPCTIVLSYCQRKPKNGVGVGTRLEFCNNLSLAPSSYTSNCFASHHHYSMQLSSLFPRPEKARRREVLPLSGVGMRLAVIRRRLDTYIVQESSTFATMFIA